MDPQNILDAQMDKAMVEAKALFNQAKDAGDLDTADAAKRAWIQLRKAATARRTRVSALGQD